ncbi:hypothetical protein AB4Z40_27190 [Bosea sp. 2YAB26]|uniref:hypothetical protein n=1 Tax=Bosea sp. 2YAB26 TaxID=3237478 RepID=UPI003F8FF9BE
MNIDVITTRANNALRKLDVALWVKFVRGEDQTVDDEFLILCGVRDTGWSVQCGHRYGVINRWIEKEGTHQSWDYPSHDVAFAQLSELLGQEGWT